MKNFDQTIRLLENAAYYYVICTSMDSNYSYINSNYAKRFSHVDNNFVGKPFHITMHPDDIAATTAAGQACLMDKNKLASVRIRKHDGKGGYIITQWEFKGMFDDDGNPQGVFCLGYDITQFITALEKKDLILTDIAFSQSHVIRRPLANIMGVADALKHYDLPAEVNELIDILQQNALELDSVIRDTAKNIYS